MRRIVCFGDSNTWGYNPNTGERFAEDVRWPCVLGSLLGDGYQILEEGQNGRTIANADPWEWGCKSGIDYVLPMVESHSPFDLLIVMLGSNDLKAKFSLPAPDIAGSLQNMLMKTKGFMQYQLRSNAKILIVSPPHLGEGLETSPFEPFFDCSKAINNSKKLAKWYSLVASQFGCEFIDAATVCKAGNVDSLHLLEDGHRALAEALADKVKLIFQEEV
ncbi:MAG: acylhydrolase [Saccharofermentans sp.]|nr:acylhydrolase [Saccharofermentans sp.]